MSIDKKDLERLYIRRREALRKRIALEQKHYIDSLRDELVNKPLPGQTKEEKEASKHRLLKYVQRYVFLKNLEPLDTDVARGDLFKTSIFYDDSKRVKNFLGFLLMAREVLSNFLKMRSLVMAASVVFFFSFELWIHYYSSFSLKDVNISFQTIVDKIPPFF